jgi:hypothetical protein
MGVGPNGSSFDGSGGNLSSGGSGRNGHVRRHSAICALMGFVVTLTNELDARDALIPPDNADTPDKADGGEAA